MKSFILILINVLIAAMAANALPIGMSTKVSASNDEDFIAISMDSTTKATVTPTMTEISNGEDSIATTTKATATLTQEVSNGQDSMDSTTAVTLMGTVLLSIMIPFLFVASMVLEMFA
jgi:hypothetical protein